MNCGEVRGLTGLGVKEVASARKATVEKIIEKGKLSVEG